MNKKAADEDVSIRTLIRCERKRHVNRMDYGFTMYVCAAVDIFPPFRFPSLFFLVLFPHVTPPADGGVNAVVGNSFTSAH